MVQINKRIRQLRSADEVMAEVSERAPSLLDHCFMDRDWIWVCGVDLRGEHNLKIREAIKEIGFRFSPGGHVMPDGQTRGHWGHSCTRPMHPRRRHEQRTTTTVAALKSDDLASMFSDLGL